MITYRNVALFYFQYDLRSSWSSAAFLTVVSDRTVKAFNRSGGTPAVALDRAGKIRFSGAWKSCASPCTKWNRLWKDKCWNKFRYNCISHNGLIDIETLRNIDFPLVSSFLTLKDSTPFLSISLLNLGECCRLHFSAAEIKVQTSKNYETSKHRYQLHHINQMVQSTTWKDACIKFKKYADCKFWVNIYKIYWDFCSVRMILYMKKILVAFWDSSDVLCFDLHLINIFAKSTKAETCTDAMLKLTLNCLSVTVEDLNLYEDTHIKI